MAVLDFGSPEFDEAVTAAYLRAREETLAAGLPVFYVTDEGTKVMEKPDGSRFEIEWIPGAPNGEAFRIIRELTRRAA